MRRVFVALMLGVPMMGVIYGLSVCQAQPVEVRHRLALMAGDLPAFLNYQPTDGATRGGQVRRDMRFLQVDPD